MVDLVLLTITIYVASGTLFAVVFVWRGMGRIDPVARHAPWTFRLLMIPGSAALWPLLAARWRRASRGWRGT